MRTTLRVMYNSNQGHQQPEKVIKGHQQPEKVINKSDNVLSWKC